MITFADIAVPVVVSIVVAAVAAIVIGFAVSECVFWRRAWRRRQKEGCAPFRRWLTAQLREVFRIPFSTRGDGEPLDEDETRVFGGYVVAEQDKRPDAPEPRHERRQL